MIIVDTSVTNSFLFQPFFQVGWLPTGNKVVSPKALHFSGRNLGPSGDVGIGNLGLKSEKMYGVIWIELCLYLICYLLLP